ncbi:MAG: hypothetical protein Q4G33_06495 [bacterium]|nr:hypothetical protein [bacterium]
MKRINKATLSKIAKIKPESCILIRIIAGESNAKIKLEGRLKLEGNKIKFVRYKNRMIDWPEFFEGPKSILNWISKTESEAIVESITDKEAVKSFIEAAECYKAYALSDIEFNEVVPVLKEYHLAFFIERGEEKE